jgi:hypothetical protein
MRLKLEPTMLRYFVLPTAVLVLIVSGVAHGLRINRWGAPRDLEAAGDRLATVPTVIGDWESTPQQIDPRQLEVAEATAHLARRYVNRRTGDEVQILILCGRPGPVSLHPPTLCYQGSGYSIPKKPDPYTVENSAGPLGTMQTVQMVKDGPAPEPLRVFWAWSNGGAFSAPDDPRITFIRAPFLYKLYVVRRMARTDESLQDDPSTGFIRELLSTLRTNLSATP